MRGLSRLSGTSVSSPSPPSSPRHRPSRLKPIDCSIGGGGGPGGGGSAGSGLRGGWPMEFRKLIDRLVFFVISAVFRRRGVLLFAPMLYISGMLLYMGSLNIDSSGARRGMSAIGKGQAGGFVLNEPRLPGSLYRSPEVFEKLLPFIQAEDNQTSIMLSTVWPSSLHQRWKPCISNSDAQAGLPTSYGYFIIEANGGLNQQRLSICDAVAVASLLNATLVIPFFHLNSVWRDSSKFGDIFDEDFFIHTLRNRVNVVKKLPSDVLEQYDNNISSIVNLRLKAWSSPKYYLQKVVPKLLEFRAVRVAPFSNRLAQVVPPDIQELRCFSNFEALRFSEQIRTLAELMVERMVRNSSRSGGRYVSVHLRFEEDMVAFSCCIYDGGAEEKLEMDIAREKGWRGKFHRKGRIIMPGAIRRNGKCPLTPLEVGMMLRGMGFDNSTSVYVASGKIYKAEKYMAPLRQLFPLLETKETLATPEELASFQGHSSRLAALDYTVCLHSEVFVTTQGGNFPHFLMGHRRYLYGGHAKTILPDKRKLALLFDNPSVRWVDFKRLMRDMLHRSDVKGGEMKKSSASLYTFPMPDCMCKDEERNNTGLLRCGKSCRLRWINYLRPDLKRGNFTEEEDELIIKLHSLLGNKWSLIAGRLPGRTDNEIKNYWNTHIKRKLLSRGVDPLTHRPIESSTTLTASIKPKSEPRTLDPSSVLPLVPKINLPSSHSIDFTKATTRYIDTAPTTTYSFNLVRGGGDDDTSSSSTALVLDRRSHSSTGATTKSEDIIDGIKFKFQQENMTSPPQSHGLKVEQQSQEDIDLELSIGLSSNSFHPPNTCSIRNNNNKFTPTTSMLTIPKSVAGLNGGGGNDVCLCCQLGFQSRGQSCTNCQTQQQTKQKAGGGVVSFVGFAGGGLGVGVGFYG